MSLSTEQIQKFRELYQKNFGSEISYEVAYEKGVKLLRMMEIILQNNARVLAKAK